MEHCAALARLETAVPTAHERLEALVGRDFARLLLDVLLDGRAPRRR